MNRVVDFIISVAFAIISFLSPISGDMKTLLLVLSCNFVVGLATAYIVEGGEFDFKKAWRFFVEAFIILGVEVVVLAIGLFKNTEDAALQCVSFITFIVMYFYLTKMIRNLKKFGREGTPYYLCMSVLYDVLTLEIVKKLPFLAKYANNDNSNTDTNTNNNTKDNESK
ncbi:MAG: hypothetical protein E7073_06675 [Bacteroidales bacterium]|nr:hypothetical protein [Bacteroidales bacterium]